MGDVGEDFRFMKELKKQRRENNLKNNLDILERAAINYKVLNNGYHLKINIAGISYDYWPSTNLVKSGEDYFNNGIAYILKKQRKSNENQ